MFLVDGENVWNMLTVHEANNSLDDFTGMTCWQRKSLRLLRISNDYLWFRSSYYIRGFELDGWAWPTVLLYIVPFTFAMTDMICQKLVCYIFYVTILLFSCVHFVM
ncbi:hypothetical protein L6164_002350 [Bauhinia variegata]|uniref:Uncharacterized protein n=1 Tax=Bauhinia variegata TaxID=167791 RepID=A0ACB9PXE7_BAUVA|nr:hypothetical protein L6164_002350 [Bauhinia variegata]